MEDLLHWILGANLDFSGFEEPNPGDRGPTTDPDG